MTEPDVGYPTEPEMSASGRPAGPPLPPAQPACAPTLPDKPSIEGLEEKWSEFWEREGTYRFDPTSDRASVYAIDTPPPTVSGDLHMGHAFSYTHTDTVARYHRMRGHSVFYPMGWDDNGLPTERRVQGYFGVRCDPALAAILTSLSRLKGRRRARTTNWSPYPGRTS